MNSKEFPLEYLKPEKDDNKPCVLYWPSGTCFPIKPEVGDPIPISNFFPELGSIKV